MDLINSSGQGKSVAYTGTAGATATFKPGANAVFVWTSTDAYVTVVQDDALTSLATATNLAIPAFTPVLLAIKNTSNPYKVSAIQITAGGTLYAMPVNGSTG